MTERIPLGFDFNKQFKSQDLQGNILLMLQTVLFFCTSTQLAELFVAFLGLFLSIKQKQQTFCFFFKKLLPDQKKL